MAQDNRRFINAVFWNLRTGAPWRDLPPDYGGWKNTHRRVCHWRGKGLAQKADRRAAADFLAALIRAVPYKIHTVLTDNGTHFTTPGNTRSCAPEIRRTLQQGELFRAHTFELMYARNNIGHRLTKPNHPWTNAQVERMNRTIKEATVRVYHYATHAQLREHLSCFMDAYNFAKRLKTPGSQTVHQFLCSCWQKRPQYFHSDPRRLSLGLYTQAARDCIMAAA